MKCVIPCAGESSRMSHVPKHLVRIGDKPLLKHVIDMWKDSVDEFVFVLRRSMTYLWEYLPENSAIVFQDEPKGLADAILRTEPFVGKRFVVALGDCIQRGEFELKKQRFPIGIGAWTPPEVVDELFVEETKKSYMVTGYNGLVDRLEEKPRYFFKDGVTDHYCGMGTYFLDKRIFKYIRELLPKLEPGGGDFTEVLQYMVLKGEQISVIPFVGKYVNVTSPEDLSKAEEILSGQGQH